MKIMPVITLYQPWATWIMREWKTIETRTHNRFAGLKGKRILIHAGQKTDCSRHVWGNDYLSGEQLLQAPEEMINGFILGSAFVYDSRELTPEDAPKALIECETQRFGLFLSEIHWCENPIPEKGEMGIWYFDSDISQKVKKPTLQQPLFL